MFKSWGTPVSTGETNEVLYRLFLKHRASIKNDAIRQCISSIDSVSDLCSVDLPFSTANSLADLIDIEKCTIAEDLYHVSQCIAFAKKRQDLDLGFDKKGEAYGKFKESEANCRTTNELFRAWKRGSIQFDPRVEAVLHSAQRKISKVLGDCPSVDAFNYRFGPGATTQVPKRTACNKIKLSQALACSGDMEPILADVLSTLPHLLPEGDVVTATVEIHPGKLVFVPKSYKTDRSVMVEPWLNSFVQLGVGDYISNCLRKVGLDVRNQEKNKSLARAASLTGDLATLDLSSASDSVSTGLVEHLLPYDWFELLSKLRTSVCDLGSEQLRLEKFSSMGNGFTFPLETLIFWALVDSVPSCRGKTSVYGDDIIMPAKAWDNVVQVLETCGFSVNMEKSFGSGYFRESCGGDYFFGFDIRPCFIKDRMTGHDAFRLHNFYVRRYMPEFAELVLELIPKHVRIWGPDGYGDGVLVGKTDWGYKSKKLIRRQWSGRLFDSWTYSKREFRHMTPGDSILPLYTIYTHEGADVSNLTQCKFTKEGVPVDTLPGTRGWKRIAIYTLG